MKCFLTWKLGGDSDSKMALNTYVVSESLGGLTLLTDASVTVTSLAA